MFVFTLIVIGLLCIAFKATRLTGIAGLTLLSLVYPWLFLVLLVIGGAISYFIYLKRKNNHVFTIPKPPFRLPFRRR